MKRNLAIITGTTSGIGRAVAEQFVEHDVHVIMACRNMEKANRVRDEITSRTQRNHVDVLEVDMAEQKSIRAFVSEFQSKYSRLDILIHNAAVFDPTKKERHVTKEGHEVIWATNHLGPFLMTNLMLDLLHDSPDGRILTVSSKGLLAVPLTKVDFNDPEYEHRKGFSVQRAYYQSKLAQVMFTYQLATKLEGTTTKINCIRVGNVAFSKERLDEYGISEWKQRIYSIKRRFSITPEEMARIYVRVALDEEYRAANGKHIDEEGKFVGSNKFSKEKQNWEKLWKLSTRQTQLDRKNE